jgi:hypothetical protein
LNRSVVAGCRFYRSDAACPFLEARQALQDVTGPADILAELAIADDVDADFGLLPDDVSYGAFQARVVGGFVKWLAVELLLVKKDQIGRADQTSAKPTN